MPIRRFAAGLTLVITLAACGSAAPAGSTPAAGTPPAGTSATPQALTTPPATAPATSQGPFVMPSFSGDPDLAARFPKQVDGKPLGQVTTAKFVDFLRALNSTQAEIDTMSQSFAAVGVDLNTVVVGSANATVNGSEVGIFAFRVPGMDATKWIQNYGLLSASNEGDTLKSETVGGKSVSVVRSADGYASTWLYASGDVLWTLNTSDQKEAEAVFAALP